MAIRCIDFDSVYVKIYKRLYIYTFIVKKTMTTRKTINLLYRSINIKIPIFSSFKPSRHYTLTSPVSVRISKRYYPGFFGFFRSGHVSKVLQFLSYKPSSSLIPYTLAHRPKILRRVITERHSLHFTGPKIFFINPAGMATPELPPLLEPAPILPTQQLLGPSYPDKNLVSGLKSYTEVEKYLKENSLLAEEYRQTICVLFMKVVHSFTKEPYETLEKALESGLHTVFGSLENLQMSFELKTIIGTKLISFIQHLTVIFWNNQTFPHKILQDLSNNKINCESFEESKVKILSIIELSVIKRFITETFKYSTFKGKYHLINPEGFSKMLTYFCEISSKRQTGQKHADLFVVQINSNGQEIDKWYIDIKSYLTVGVDYRRVSLFHPNDKLADMLSNDLIVSLKRFITNNNIENQHPIRKLYFQLLEIKTFTKNSKEKFSLMLKRLHAIMFNKEFEKLNISIVIDAGHDAIFDYKLEMIYKPRFESLKNDPMFQNKIKELLERLFPKVPAINEEENYNNIKGLIEHLFPPEEARELLNNFDNLKILVTKAMSLT